MKLSEERLVTSLRRAEQAHIRINHPRFYRINNFQIKSGLILSFSSLSEPFVKALLKTSCKFCGKFLNNNLDLGSVLESSISSYVETALLFLRRHDGTLHGRSGLVVMY